MQTCRDRGLAQYADGAARYFTKREYPEINRLVKALLLRVWDVARETPYCGELVFSVYADSGAAARISCGLPELSLPRSKKLLDVSPALTVSARLSRGERRCGQPSWRPPVQ